MKKYITLLLSLLFLTGLASCTGQSKTQTQEADSLLTFRLGVMPSVDYLPFAVAKQLGYYDSLGLKLEIVKFSSPHERDAALQAGELDGTITDYTSALLQSNGDLPVRVWTACQGYFALMSNIGPSGDDWQVLKGKKFALSSNTVIDYATDLFLQQHGLNPTEIEKVEVQKVPLRLEMLASGQVDAAVLPEPLVGVALNRGLHSLANTNAQQVEITAVALWGNEEKTELLQRLQQGYDRAVEQINANPQKEAREVLSTELNIPIEVARATNLPQYKPVHKPTIAELDQVANWLKARKLIKPDYSVAKLVE